MTRPYLMEVYVLCGGEAELLLCPLGEGYLRVAPTLFTGVFVLRPYFSPIARPSPRLQRL
jgi:hypothetical protein